MITQLLQMFGQGIGLIIVLITLHQVMNSTDNAANGGYIHLPSLYLIAYCMIGITLMSFHIRKVIKMLRNLIWPSPAQLDRLYLKISSLLRPLCDAYYTEGSEALQKVLAVRGAPKIWKTILGQLDSNMDLKDIRSLLVYNSSQEENDYNRQISILNTLSGIAPSLGVLGTVMGLVKLLGELNNMEKIGPNMALALLTTLYGIFFSVIVINPLVTRLEDVRDYHMKLYDQAIYWIYLVESRKPSILCDPQHLTGKKSA